MLAGSSAYLRGDGVGSVAGPATEAGARFYGVLAVAMALGLALDYVGLNAVKMLFWSAVANGVLAPPLIVLVVLLTSDRKVMGDHVNPPLLRWLGWIAAGIMTAAAVAMFVAG